MVTVFRSAYLGGTTSVYSCTRNDQIQ